MLDNPRAAAAPRRTTAMRRGRARRSIVSTPACSSTPATRACAKCRCCTTSCARCSTRRRRPAKRRCSRATSPCSRRTSTSMRRTSKRCSAAPPARARELPYTLADTSPLASASLAEAFLRLLELPLRAPTLGDVLDLLAVPAIAARFSLDDAERGLLQDWLQDAGARWGLDAADRARHGARPATAPTPSSSRSIACCSATPAATDEDIAGVAPWPALEGQAADSARWRCCASWHCCATCRTRLADAQPPARWQRTIERACSTTRFAVERDSIDAAVLQAPARADRELRRRRRARRLRRAGRTRRGAGTPARPNSAQADARAPFLSGGICFGRMVPMRLIPFRVTCLLGLDEDAFPARDAPRSDQPHRARARHARAAQRAIRRAATPTATCSCSCSPPPDACCT